MEKQILEFLLHSGWKNTEGRRLSLSVVYDSTRHLTSEIWSLGNDTFTLGDITEININFELETFVIWTHED